MECPYRHFAKHHLSQQIGRFDACQSPGHLLQDHLRDALLFLPGWAEPATAAVLLILALPRLGLGLAHANVITCPSPYPSSHRQRHGPDLMLAGFSRWDSLQARRKKTWRGLQAQAEEQTPEMLLVWSSAETWFYCAAVAKAAT